MNDYVKFLLLFPSIMWLTGYLIFGPNWFVSGD